MIDFFHEVDPEKCGGKGKNLVALSKASFPVPPGFIITVDAYTQYEETGKSTVPAEIERRIPEYYNELVSRTGSPRVSVRSSASAEDMPHASFAGQYETYLYVQTLDEMVERIHNCWDSLWSERATMYRRRMKIPEKGLKMAVIVQTMIEPRSAGILFTAHTHSKEPGQRVMIIESNWGCGESVVSGQATPDHFVVSKEMPYPILEKISGDKEVFIQGGPAGETILPTPAEKKKEFSLTPGEISRLCEMGNKIENHFGSPQDIEWALENNGTLFILQSRPITSYCKR
jgi:pyruvate,water dikinase